MSPSGSPKLTTLQIALGNKRVIAYCLYVCIATLSTGFDASLLLPLKQFLKQFGYEYQGEYVVSAAHQALWNGILIPGCIVGAAISCPINDILGRKFVFILGSIVFALGVVQQQIALDWKVLATGKFFYYIGMTMYTIGATTYISEITPPGIRGLMLGLVNLALYIWMFVGSCVLQRVQTVSGNLSFRIPLIVQYIVPLIIFSCTWFIPETPYWLVGKGRTDDAKAALRRLHGEGHDVDHHLREIENDIDQLRMSNVSYLDCFRGVNSRRTIIATGVLAGQQVVGLWFVIGYTTYFFTLSGVKESEAFILTEVMCALLILANIGSWLLIERFGRRVLLLAGTSVLLVSHLIIGSVGTSSKFNTGPMPKVVVSFMIIFAVFYQFSLGTAGWAVAAEVSSPALRASTAALAVAANFLSGSVVFLTLPYLINPDQLNLGPKVGFIFAAPTLITLVFLYYAVPEMKGRTYEELNYMFQHRVPTREFKDYSVRFGMQESRVVSDSESLGETA